MAKPIVGIVASDKADKTIVVSVHTPKVHPIYKKRYTKVNRIMAHDATNQAKIGDRVSIIESRPISANKRYRLEKVIEKAGVEHREEDAE